jgi:hypothetical protein
MRTLAVVIGLLLCGLTLLAADLSGTWSADVALDAGNGTAKFVFTQKGDALSGTYTGALGEAKVSGTVKGNQVEWTFANDEAGKVVYKGTLDGDKIKGTVEYGSYGKGTFTAEKK